MENKGVPRFTVYGRTYCHLCEDLVAALRAHLGDRPYELEIVDVDSDADLEARYGQLVPVLVADGVSLCHYHFDPQTLDAYLAKFR